MKWVKSHAQIRFGFHSSQSGHGARGIGQVTDRTNPDISPLYGDLRGLPPALLIIGSLDIVLEDNLAMAGRLSAAGGAVDIRVYPESRHGFTSFDTAMASAALRDIDSWLGDRFLDT